MCLDWGSDPEQHSHTLNPPPHPHPPKNADSQTVGDTKIYFPGELLPAQPTVVQYIDTDVLFKHFSIYYFYL